MTDELIEALERLADANAEGLALSKSRVLTDQGPQHRILYIEVIARDVLPTRSGPSAAMVREAFELGEIFVAEAMRRNPPPERIVVSDEAMERVTESLDRPPAPTQALRELITEPAAPVQPVASELSRTASDLFYPRCKSLAPAEHRAGS